MTLITLRKRVENYRELVSSISNTEAKQFGLLKSLPFYSDWQRIDSQKIVRDFNHK